MSVIPRGSHGNEPVFIAADSVQRVPVTQVFSVIRRQKLLIAAVLLLVNALSLAYVSRLKPYFNASASVLIETNRSAFNDLQAAMKSVTAETIALRTQADIIQSSAMALKVVDTLDLVHVPEFANAIDPPPSALHQLQTEVIHWLHLPPISSARLLTDDERRQMAAELLALKISVGNVGRSYIIDIAVRTGDSALSAQIANAYASFYIAFNKDLKKGAIKRGSDLLDRQIEPLRDRLRATEMAVEHFREQNGLLMSQMGDGGEGQNRSTIASQQLSQINAQLTDAVANVAKKEASLSAIAATQRRGGSAYGIPEVIASPLIQRLREQEIQITSRVASLNAVPGSSNPLLGSSNAILADVRQQINAEVAKIVDSLRSEAAAARARRDTLQDRLSELQAQVTIQNQAGVSLKQLESEADAARKVYREFLGRYEQTSNQLALQEPEASLVSAAQPPLSRSGPPRGLYAILGALVSAVLSMLLAFLFDRTRKQVIRTPAQLESETGLTALGITPSLKNQMGGRLPLRLWASQEALSLLQSILQRGHIRAAPRVVMVTSALAGEGKTWFAASLAGNSGRIGERVLLVDCDRYRPSVATVLGLPKQDNESEEKAPYLLRRNVIPGVDVVTLRQGSLDNWDGMRGMLRTAREHYGLIVLDTPPVLSSADAAALASASDGVIMVVRWDATPVAKLRAALRILRAVGAHMLGGMLTQVDICKVKDTEGIDTIAYGEYGQKTILRGLQ